MKKKFTLIELIIVIVVIGILAGMALPKVTAIVKNAKLSAMINDKETLEKTILLYYQKYDELPLLNEGQELIVSNDNIQLTKLVQAEEVINSDMGTIYTSLQETLKYYSDEEEYLYRIDISKIKESLSKNLKYGTKKTEKDFYVYSTKTNNVYYYKPMINGDGGIYHNEFNTALKETKLINKKFSYNLSEDGLIINSKPIVELTTDLSNLNTNSILKWEYKFIDEDKTPTKISFILNNVEYDNFNNIPTQLKEGEYTAKLKMQDSKGIWSDEITKEFIVDSNFNIEIKVNSVALSERHTMKICNDKNLYAWGYNFSGELGTGNNKQQLSPQLITLPNGEKATSISLSVSNSMAITDKNHLYTWGYNFFGQLGIGTNTSCEVIPKLVTLPNKEIPIYIASGGYHSMVITDKGNLYAWGSNDVGQLGLGTNTHQASPKKVNIPNGEKPISINLGYNHSMIITDKGNLYSWGQNNKGQLGIGSEINKNIPQKVNIPNEEKVISISLSKQHSMIITDKGNLYAWGSNNGGQLGLNNTTTLQTSPQLVSLPNGEKPISIASGGAHSMTITDKGNLYIWGYNSSGQLGLGNTEGRTTPQLISLPNKEKPIFINAGADYSMAIGNKGNVYFWGGNSSGQLGIGNTIDQLTPIKVELP